MRVCVCVCVCVTKREAVDTKGGGSGIHFLVVSSRRDMGKKGDGGVEGKQGDGGRV